VVGIVSKDIQDRIRLVPARATLHARTGAEVARKAHSPAGMISKTIEFDMNIDLPNPLRSTNFIPTELPSGRSFNHPHCYPLLPEWLKPTETFLFGGKQLLDYRGESVFAELYVLRLLQESRINQ
jgi:hypothetical protein